MFFVWPSQRLFSRPSRWQLDVYWMTANWSIWKCYFILTIRNMIDSAIVCCYMTKEHYKYNKNYLQKRKVILEHLDWRRNIEWRITRWYSQHKTSRKSSSNLIGLFFSHGFREYWSLSIDIWQGLQHLSKYNISSALSSFMRILNRHLVIALGSILIL